MTRPQLVLDIGGVLATNLSPLFWKLLSTEAVVSEEALYSLYKQQVSNQLWTGVLSEEQFWAWIKEHTPLVHTKQARAILDISLKPLPALEWISKWSTAADVHILSNHLAAWVMPIINPIKDHLSSITISSEIGLKKPHADIYIEVMRKLPAGSVVLFVDDQEKNLQQAARHGWQTLLADQDDLWVSRVLPLIERHRKLEK